MIYGLTFNGLKTLIVATVLSLVIFIDATRDVLTNYCHQNYYCLEHVMFGAEHDASHGVIPTWVVAMVKFLYWWIILIHIRRLWIRIP